VVRYRGRHGERWRWEVVRQEKLSSDEEKRVRRRSRGELDFL